jgi:hypothetical protein
LLAFARENVPNPAERWPDVTVCSAFWEEKGIGNKYALSPAAGLIVQRVEQRVGEVFEEESREAYKRERALMPEMVEACLARARGRRLKRLNQADVAAILAEKHPQLDAQTLRDVWQRVNPQLKA